MCSSGSTCATSCNGLVNLFLLLQYDLHDTCKELLPIEFSWSCQLRQYKHVLSCVSQHRSRFHHRCLLVFCKALPLASEFLTSLERFFMVCFDSSSSGSMKKIPRYCLALLSFGFSMAYFCFALRFDASDICFHISGHTLSGLEVVCFLVSLLPDHVYPSSGFSSSTVNLVKPVHASDNSRSSSTFQ